MLFFFFYFFFSSLSSLLLLVFLRALIQFFFISIPFIISLAIKYYVLRERVYSCLSVSITKNILPYMRVYAEKRTSRKCLMVTCHRERAQVSENRNTHTHIHTLTHMILITIIIRLHRQKGKELIFISLATVWHLCWALQAVLTKRKKRPITGFFSVNSLLIHPFLFPFCPNQTTMFLYITTLQANYKPIQINILMMNQKKKKEKLGIW